MVEGRRKRKRGATTVWKRRKSNKAKTDHVSADCNHSESDTCDIISASESEGDDAKKEIDSEKAAASSGEIPPDQQIEVLKRLSPLCSCFQCSDFVAFYVFLSSQ